MKNKRYYQSFLCKENYRNFEKDKIYKGKFGDRCVHMIMQRGKLHCFHDNKEFPSYLDRYFYSPCETKSILRTKLIDKMLNDN